MSELFEKLLIKEPENLYVNPSTPRANASDSIMDLDLLFRSGHSSVGVKTKMFEEIAGEEKSRWEYILSRSFEMYRDFTVEHRVGDVFKNAILYITFRIPKKEFRDEYVEKEGKVHWRYENDNFEIMRVPLKTITSLGEVFKLRFSDCFITVPLFSQLILEVNYHSSIYHSKRHMIVEVIQLHNQERKQFMLERVV